MLLSEPIDQGSIMFHFSNFREEGYRYSTTRQNKFEDYLNTFKRSTRNIADKFHAIPEESVSRGQRHPLTQQPK